jgi:AmmeMemoRadiSam system protein A
VPHPPLLVAGIGKGEEHGAQQTLDAYHQVAREIAGLAPELLVVATPHGRLYRDTMYVSPGAGQDGSWKDFGYSGDTMHATFDTAFVEALTGEAAHAGIPLDATPHRGDTLDHGTMLPLYFINQYLAAPYKVVRVSISFLGEAEHYALGRCVARVAEEMGRHAVLIASGDLSHRLKEDGPYGFDAAGPVFDERVTRAFAAGAFGEFFTFSGALREHAGECGLNSFLMMAGAFDGYAVQGELLSYEGPWGVGYGVARFKRGVPSNVRHFIGVPEAETGQKGTRARSCRVSIPVRLAQAVLADHLDGTPERNVAAGPRVAALLAAAAGTGALLGTREAHDVAAAAGAAATAATAAAADGDGGGGDNNPLDAQELDLLRTQRAGVFVSFKKQGDLRGCIGTIEPITAAIAEEIMGNTISAATRDPRFPPITRDELPLLTCSVDILGEPEPITGTHELDVKRYGVIVSTARRRGLLLPSLEGVDTPAQQVAIALQKANIAPHEPYQLERFEVARYT